MIENIYTKIKELSDLNLQRKLWLNQNNDTGYISSYIELINSLFNDFNFDKFIESTSDKIGQKNNFIIDLNKLRYLLNSYEEKESDEEIINDTEWQKITEQAKKVIENWNRTY